jgi:sulfur-oxidizing protein SoxZ
MTAPITLKLRQKDDRTEIEIQVLHPMEPGDAFPQKSGNRSQPLFLQSMVIQLNEKTLVEGQLSASLSKNPVFGFSFSGIKAGDKFTVQCKDNKDGEFKSEIVAKF